MAFEDLFRRKFTNPLPMSTYDPAFGEEELLGVQAVRPQIVGTTEIPVGPTGLYGRALAAAGAREGARAAASGDLVARARGQRIRASQAAELRRVQQQAQAERAGRLQQGRLRGNIMAGIGGVAEEARGVVEDPLFKKWVKGIREEKQRKRDALDALVAPQMQSMESLLSPENFGRAAFQDRFGPAVAFSPGEVPTPQDRMLERFSLGDFSLPSYDLGGF